MRAHRAAEDVALLSEQEQTEAAANELADNAAKHARLHLHTYPNEEQMQAFERRLLLQKYVLKTMAEVLPHFPAREQTAPSAEENEAARLRKAQLRKDQRLQKIKQARLKEIEARQHVWAIVRYGEEQAGWQCTKCLCRCMQQTVPALAGCRPSSMHGRVKDMHHTHTVAASEVRRPLSSKRSKLATLYICTTCGVYSEDNARNLWKACKPNARGTSNLKQVHKGCHPVEHGTKCSSLVVLTCNRRSDAERGHPEDNVEEATMPAICDEDEKDDLEAEFTKLLDEEVISLELLPEHNHAVRARVVGFDCSEADDSFEEEPEDAMQFSVSAADTFSDSD